MDKIMGTSRQLCTKCFGFLQVKRFGGSCSVCSSLRLSVFNNKMSYNKRVESISYGAKSICYAFDKPFWTMSQKSSLLSSIGNYHVSLKLPCQQSVFHRNFASHSSTPPNPLPPRKKSTDHSRKSPISWRNLMIVAGVGGALLIGMTYVKKEKEQEREKARNLKMGKAKLGGDWTLIDHHGNLRSSRDFRGQWLLIYFGFTNCPDICPEELEKIVSVIDQTDADPNLPKIQPIIITVDPERDTAEALKEYCAEFSPRLLGFTGSQEQIYTATRAYRVYFSQGPKDEDNDYIVDHSIISYLVNPNGDFVDYFGQNKKDNEIFKSIKLHILTYEKQKKGQK